MKKPNGHWTKDKCHEISLKYTKRIDFKNSHTSVYATACRNKWLDDICSHMKYDMIPNHNWDFDKCKNEALKYKSRNEFQKGNKSAYEYCRQNDILNAVCTHMVKLGSKFYRCIYVFEFNDNSAYVGLTYNLNSRIKDHLRKGTVYNYIKINSSFVVKQLTDYIEIGKSTILENEYVKTYQKNGWKILNKIKTGGVGGNTLVWNKENCKKEAVKYKFRNDFRIGSNGAYISAYKNGWLDDICSHMMKKPRVTNCF